LGKKRHGDLGKFRGPLKKKPHPKAGRERLKRGETPPLAGSEHEQGAMKRGNGEGGRGREKSYPKESQKKKTKTRVQGTSEGDRRERLETEKGNVQPDDSGTVTNGFK